MCMKTLSHSTATPKTRRTPVQAVSQLGEHNRWQLQKSACHDKSIVPLIQHQHTFEAPERIRYVKASLCITPCFWQSAVLKRARRKCVSLQKHEA
jgi:hypothetical protein